ncbi:hypothetical protein [Thermoactinospora rubra]|uniref:hypothetical protein n=1 Tax=Thermoactinospora rubra TaxID=1088767 RepID=UPI000A0F4B1B|nr:hypothetical protein [Thermoactinospora rubra]
MDRTSPRSVEDVDVDSLLALVAESLGYTCVFAPDGASLTLLGGAGADGDGHREIRREIPREITVRVSGLRREAGRRAREDWPMLVSEHLARRVADAALPDPCDLDQVRTALRVTVEAVDDVPDLSRVVGRHLGSDLVELLTVRSRPVRPEEAGCWPIPPAQALEVALANMRGDRRLSVSRAEELTGVRAWRLSGATASHLRWLGEYVAVPRDGVLVVLPDRGSVVVHPVEGIGVVRAIERLRMHALRSGGPTTQVYWWHEGRLTRIRADIVLQEGQTRLVVVPPPDFARVLARLAG